MPRPGSVNSSKRRRHLEPNDVRVSKPLVVNDLPLYILGDLQRTLRTMCLAWCASVHGVNRALAAPGARGSGSVKPTHTGHACPTDAMCDFWAWKGCATYRRHTAGWAKRSTPNPSHCLPRMTFDWVGLTLPPTRPCCRAPSESVIHLTSLSRSTSNTTCCPRMWWRWGRATTPALQ